MNQQAFSLDDTAPVAALLRTKLAEYLGREVDTVQFEIIQDKDPNNDRFIGLRFSIMLDGKEPEGPEEERVSLFMSCIRIGTSAEKMSPVSKVTAH